MNWLAGIIAFFLYVPAMLVVFYIWHKRNKEIDRKYDEEMKRIRKYWGVKE
jgi:hypothetical protein